MNHYTYIKVILCHQKINDPKSLEFGNQKQTRIIFPEMIKLHLFWSSLSTKDSQLLWWPMILHHLSSRTSLVMYINKFCRVPDCHYKQGGSGTTGLAWTYIKVCGYSDCFFAKTWTKGHWPLDDLWPHICWGLMCDSPQGSLCPSPMKIHQSMWIQWPFFAKTWTKGHWPLDDVWPHICWGHMCDSTQGSLCPSPMKIHQCMWIQWSILQITNQRSLTPDDL